MANSNVSCIQCGKNFYKHANLKRHLLKIHGCAGECVFFPCYLCGKDFLKKSNLKKHLALCGSSRLFICFYCGKSFRRKTKLRKHIGYLHIERSCKFCGDSFPTFKILQMHVKSSHGPKFSYMSCFDDDCDFSGSTGELSDHYVNFHKIHYVETGFTFNSYEAFEQWKARVEEQDMSNFVKLRGSHFTASGKKKVLFSCNRSGKARLRENKLRKGRMKGSCKKGIYCPASIRLTILPNNTIHVAYNQTHLGHKMELNFLRTPKQHKTEPEVKSENNDEDLTENEVLVTIHGSHSQTDDMSVAYSDKNSIDGKISDLIGYWDILKSVGLDSRVPLAFEMALDEASRVLADCVAFAVSESVGDDRPVTTMVGDHQPVKAMVGDHQPVTTTHHREVVSPSVEFSPELPLLKCEVITLKSEEINDESVADILEEPNAEHNYSNSSNNSFK